MQVFIAVCHSLQVAQAAQLSLALAVEVSPTATLYTLPSHHLAYRILHTNTLNIKAEDQ
jgi:hypothetical protein